MLLRILSYAMVLSALSFPTSGQHGDLNVSIAQTHTWHADHVRHLIGFEEVASNSEGNLSITPEALVFRTFTSATSVPKDEITAVFVGDERVETGGLAGKAARIAIPYGGGAVLGTVTQKQVGLLTVEYRDRHEGLHTAVFQLAKGDAKEAEANMIVTAKALRPSDVRMACSVGTAATALTLTQLGVGVGTIVPSEFEAVLYESLFSTIQDKAKGSSIYRDGDRSGLCRTHSALITVDDFSKGNAAARASTGPFGFFVGVTRLRVNLKVLDSDGAILVNEEVKASRRGDRESLDAAKSIGKDAAKRLATMIGKATYRPRVSLSG